MLLGVEVPDPFRGQVNGLEGQGVAVCSLRAPDGVVVGRRSVADTIRAVTLLEAFPTKTSSFG